RSTVTVRGGVCGWVTGKTSIGRLSLAKDPLRSSARDPRNLARHVAVRVGSIRDCPEWSCWPPRHAAGASDAVRLCFKVEGALNGVAPGELPDHTVLRDVHLVHRGFGHIGRRAGNRAKD